MSRSSGLISSNYRQLAPDEIDSFMDECASAWQDPNIPARQYELAVKDELEGYRNGKPSAPFDALVQCLRRLPLEALVRPRLLDAGASAGYYSDVLKIAGFDVRYTGLDFSPAFKELAEKLYPGIDYKVGDCRSLPFHDDWFDIVLSGACLMHVREYQQVIAEAVRVSSRYVIFHRTPITANNQPTAYFEKEAYGVRCLEIHFQQSELLSLFSAHGLRLVYTTHVFRQADGFAHNTYLFEKKPGLNHIQV